MARHGPLDLVAWIAGYDMAGPGALMEANDSLEAQTTDVTPLGPNGTIKTSAPLGTVEYVRTEKGWLDTEARSLRDLLDGGGPDTPWRSIFGYGGDEIGSPVTIATDVRLGKHDVMADLGDLTKIQTDYYNHTGSDVYEDAELLSRAGPVTGVTDVGQTPGSAYRLDNGASSDGGAVICIMVDIGGSRWRGYDELHFRLRHSSTAGSGYADLGPQIQWDRGDTGQRLIEIAAGTTINRYLGLRFTFTAPRDTFSLQGAHASGATDLTVDAVTGDERIEEGDRLLISTETYTVESAAETGTPGTWEITLTTGLQSNVADNTSVTLTGSNVSLRYAAAIKRF